MKQMKTEGKEMPVSADLVFFNGKIAKVDRKFGFCTAIAVKATIVNFLHDLSDLKSESNKRATNTVQK